MDKNERLIKYLEEHPGERMRLESKMEEASFDVRGFEKRNIKPDLVKRAKAIERAQKMFDLYKEGYTYREVGVVFEVTHERVRQLITQYFSVELEAAKVEIAEIRKKQHDEANKVKCAKCKNRFPKRGNRKYCSTECRRANQMKNEYPDWVGDRKINRPNFTEEEWREINRIRTLNYYRRNREKMNAVARDWYKNNKDKAYAYHKRCAERKEFGEVLYTEIPNPTNLKAMKP